MSGKILYIASTFSHIRNFHLPYLKWYQEEGFAVHAAGSGEPGVIPYADRILTIPFQKRMFSFQNLKAAFRIAALIRREQYDIVSVHTSLAAFFTRLGVLFSGRRPPLIINTVHGYLFSRNTSVFKRTLLLCAEKLLTRQTDLLITMNREDYEIASQYRLCRNGNIVFVNGMGLSLKRFSSIDPAKKTELRNRYELPANKLILVYAAEFSKRKNQSFLISSLVSLPDEERQGLLLLLLGDGDMLGECRVLAEQLGIADLIRFTGYQPDVRPYYQLSDIAVSSSRSEGLPFNLLEAMATGLPVLASEVKGHTDLVESGQNGFLFPLRESSVLLQQLRQLMCESGLREQMGKCGYQKVQEYSLERVFPEVTRILKDAWTQASAQRKK